MNVVILGLSHFGLQCAQLLHAAGHQLAVIDRNPDAFERLPKQIPIAPTLGIGIDEGIMRKAGIEHADLFIAATNNDNANLMAAQVAKTVFNIKRSVARVHDAQRADIFNAMGQIEVVCPTLVSAKSLVASIPAEARGG